jgi:hypothetical protein
MSLVNENIENITKTQDSEVSEKIKTDLDVHVPKELNTTEYIPAEEESKDLIQVFKL